MTTRRRGIWARAVAGLAVGAALIVPAAASAAADLSIDKRDSADPVVTGSAFTYTIDVANGGPDPAGAVTVEDDLPNDLDLASATASQGTCETAGGDRVTCELGTLAPGATATVTLEVSARKAGTITNTATVTTTDPDSDPANNQDTETTVIADGPTGPVCKGQAATIIGTNGDDLLVGTDKRDVIFAGGGADRVDALGGKDIVCGKGGADLLRGGDDDDVVRGGGGRDRVRGNAGDDNLGGGARRDRLGGGLGNDLMKGGPGNDRCRGGAGADTKRSC